MMFWVITHFLLLPLLAVVLVLLPVLAPRPLLLPAPPFLFLVLLLLPLALPFLLLVLLLLPLALPFLLLILHLILVLSHARTRPIHLPIPARV
jgi:hypothetical protein